MPDRAEAARLAIVAALEAIVDLVVRNRLEFSDFASPGQISADIEDGTPQRDGEMMPDVRLWRLDMMIAVAAHERTMTESRAALSGALTAIETALLADPTLGGVVDTLRVEAAGDTDETVRMGADEVAAKVLPVRVFYRTGGAANAAV